MSATVANVGKSKPFFSDQQRAMIAVDNKKPDSVNRHKRQKQMEKQMSKRKVCPKQVIEFKGNALIVKKQKRALKSIKKDPNLLKDIPDISDAVSNSVASKSQIGSECFQKMMKETGLVIQRLSKKLDEVEGNTYKVLVDAGVEENSYKKSEFEHENSTRKIKADFAKMDEIIRHLQTHVICNSQRTIQDIPFVAEINYLRNANHELRNDVTDLKVRLRKLHWQRNHQQLQRHRQQEYDSNENNTTDLISQQTKTPTIVYITNQNRRF